MSRGVEIEHLKKNFVLTRWNGLRRSVSEVTAVDDISLSIPAGEAVAFIGPNGAGKSTTIKMLTGIMHPTCGMPPQIHASGYNAVVRKKSSIDREKQLERIERARRMTPEERLLACVNISRAVLELHRSGRQSRAGVLQKSRP